MVGWLVGWLDGWWWGGGWIPPLWEKEGGKPFSNRPVISRQCVFVCAWACFIMRQVQRFSRGVKGDDRAEEVWWRWKWKQEMGQIEWNGSLFFFFFYQRVNSPSLAEVIYTYINNWGMFCVVCVCVCVCVCVWGIQPLFIRTVQSNYLHPVLFFFLFFFFFPALKVSKKISFSGWQLTRSELRG